MTILFGMAILAILIGLGYYIYLLCTPKENQMKKYLNQEVLVKLFKPFNGSKSYIGLLHAINPSFITIKSENRNIELERKNISQIKTIYHWENQERNDEKNENNG